MILILVLIGIPLLYYFYIYKPHQYWKNLNVPYIQPVPLFGNMHKMMLQREGFYEWIQDLYSAENTNVYFKKFKKITIMLLWIALVLSIIFLYKKITGPHNHWKNLKVPYLESPPITGNILFLLRPKPIIDWIQKIYNTHSNTRYVGMFLFGKPVLMIKDLELIKKLSTKEFDHFVDHRPIITPDIDALFGSNLFFLQGHKWRNMRSTLSPAFTASKMRSMFVLMSECAEQFTNYFIEKVDSNEPMTIEMKDILTRYATDVIATTAFGIKCDSMRDKENEFYLKGKDASSFEGARMLKFIGFGISPKLMKFLGIKVFSESTANFFRNMITSNIKSREENGIVRPDMIHLLMEARKGKLKHEEKDEAAGFATVEESHVGKDHQTGKIELSDDDITAQALLFFIAGFDTISIPMCHLAYELALNEDVQKRLQKEIDEILEESKEKVSYDVIMKMKYLDMCLSETLRKCPPVGAIDRSCTDSYTIQPERPDEVPITLKKGDLIWFPAYPLHRDPQYFPNPDKFDPERFSDENKGNIKPFSYIPFGVGPRNCIGSRFALMEAKILFVHFLSKFTFEICEKSQVPLKIKPRQFNMNAENGFWLALRLRS